MRNLKDVSAETGVDLKTVRAVAAALAKQAKAEPDMVTLRHPDLPPEQVIDIDRRRTGARFAAGWVEVGSGAEPKPEPVEKAAEESKSPTESAPKRRSRTKSEEQ